MLCGEGVTAVDSVRVISHSRTEYYELLKQTEPLLSIKLPHSEDLGIILAICEGIQIHANTSAYNLIRCSCHFFSWTIAICVARRSCKWESDILSRESWHVILRTSLASISSISRQYRPNPICRVGAKWTPTRTFTGICLFQGDVNTLINHFEVEAFQDVLWWSYLELHGAIGRILPKVLLPSQLSTVLQQTLHYIESPKFLSAKRTVAENVVLSRCNQIHGHIHDTHDPAQIDGFKLESLRDASYATANVLSRLGTEDSNSSWENVWRSAWNSRKTDAHAGTSYPYTSHSPVVMYNHRPKPWEATYVGQKGMENAIRNIWRSTWDEFDGLGAECAANLMPTIVATIAERFVDIVPEQLIFGRNEGRSLNRPEHPPSFQQFIRDRMWEDFERPNRSGFSSFKYLVETVEEAMCKTWVTSLRIMRSSRYR
ncbi:unnamed protein product [Rhizoctonia solani]|uniref:Uncharacterized protein n=1 Tax=Rhizoctonia solani TaxID=456999 RepID=A0A8H3GN37_9AGAM|nr:unnamed protein product [Rhizoctonia solani]